MIILPTALLILFIIVLRYITDYLTRLDAVRLQLETKFDLIPFDKAPSVQITEALDDLLQLDPKLLTADVLEMIFTEVH